MKQWEDIKYEVIEGNIARVSLNRPQVDNAMSVKLKLQLEEALDHADADDNIRVVILAAEGSNFSRGHDVEAFATELGPHIQTVEKLVKAEREFFADRWLKIREMKKPTIGQVQGFCIAGGVSLVAMCDLVTASSDAYFQNPGLALGALGAELPVELWAFGPRRAKEMLFTGDVINAQHAMEWGLVNRIESREQLPAATLEFARRVARSGPWAVQTYKRFINKSVDQMGQAASYELGFWMHELSHWTEEHWTLRAKMSEELANADDITQTEYVSHMLASPDLDEDGARVLAGLWKDIGKGLKNLAASVTPEAK